MNYYNEIDSFAAEWLRELIKCGAITDGIVDERDILDVLPNDLKGFTQCHFFAGIGVWSYAIGQSGWADDRPVWTGSCPCQPFSAAGKRKGTADERHLWPAFFHLIRECKPVTVFGEQVASKDGLAWFDLVSSDLEAEGYAIGATDTCAAGFGAPHVRQRLYFVADSQLRPAKRQRCNLAESQREIESGTQERQWIRADFGDGSASGILANTRPALGERGETYTPQRNQEATDDQRGGATGELGYSNNKRPQGRQFGWDGSGQWPTGTTGMVNGFWGGGTEWLWCQDGKYRPVESGTSPLAHGAPNRVGRLRGYGNALVAPQAQAFIEAYLDLTGDQS